MSLSRTRAPWGAPQKLALGLIIGLAGFLRLRGLGTQPWWCDETYFWLMATHDGWFKTLLHTIVDDVYPPLYFLIIHAIDRFSIDIAVLRLPGALAGTAAAGAVYAFLRRWADGRTALFAGILAATSPVLIYYAQEMKMYALLSLWLWLLAAETWECLQDPKRGWKRLALWALCAVYTFYLALAVWAVLLGLALLHARGQWRRAANVFKGFGAAFLGFLPWLPFFFKSAVVGQPAVENSLLDRVLVYSFQNFSVGFWPPDQVLWLGLAGLSLPAILALWLARPGERRLHGYLFGLSFLPLALLWAASLLGKPLYSDRAMLVCALSFAALAGLGLGRLPYVAAYAGLGLVIGLQSYSLELYRFDAQSRRTDLRPAWERIISQWEPGDSIFHVSATETYYPFKFYALQEARLQPGRFQDEAGAALGPGSARQAGVRPNWIWAPPMAFNPSPGAGKLRAVWRSINAWLTERGWGIYAGYNRDHVDGERLEKEALPGVKRIWYLNASPEAAAKLWAPQMNAFRSGKSGWKPLEPEKIGWLKGRFVLESQEQVGDVDVYLFVPQPSPVKKKGRP